MRYLLTFFLLTCVLGAEAQLLSHQKTYTRADTLRGSITPGRSWWDLVYYDLHVKFNYADSSISGYNIIRYKILKEKYTMQIDLMKPLVIDSIKQFGTKLSFRRDGNAWMVDFNDAQPEGVV